MDTMFRSLESFRAEIHRREDSKLDLVQPSGNLAMFEGERIRMPSAEAEMLDFGITDYAHGQIASRLGIPKPYYDRVGSVVTSTGQLLRDVNVNTLLMSEDKPVLCRMLDGKLRAFLSDRYHPIDNYLVVEGALIGALQSLDQPVEIQSSAVTDTRMYLQVRFPRIVGEVEVGGVVQYGLNITNSEVGAGAVDIQSWVYRLVCKNGMVGQSVFRKIHAGRRLSDEQVDAKSFFSDETVIAEMKAFRLRLTDILRHEVNQEAFDGVVRQMKIAKGQVVNKPEETVKNVTKRWNLRDFEGEQVLSNLIGSRDYSRYGIAQAITATAHGMQDYDRQYEVEKIGGEVIELKPSEWEQVVA